VRLQRPQRLGRTGHGAIVIGKGPVHIKQVGGVAGKSLRFRHLRNRHANEAGRRKVLIEGERIGQVK
jgi:hypothetical protein